MTDAKIEVLPRGAAPTDYRSIYSKETLDIIRANKCRGATDEQFAALMMIAFMKRLNPLTGQIHFVERKSKVNGEEVKTWVPQTGIDGFRLIAVRSDEYDGQDEPTFVEEEIDVLDQKGQPTGRKYRRIVAARVSVYRKGIQRPFVGVAYFDEYVQTYYDRDARSWVPNHMWENKPRIMLAKCAEALGLRKAFPEELGDLEIPEEFGQEHQHAQESPAARYSTAPEPAPAPEAKKADKHEETRAKWRVDLAEAKTRIDMDTIAARYAKEKLATKELVEERRIAWKERLKQIEEAEKALPPPADPEPCPACDRTDGQHVEGCPSVTPPPGADGAK